MKTAIYFGLIVLAVFVGTLAALAVAGLYAKSQLQSATSTNPLLRLISPS